MLQYCLKRYARLPLHNIICYLLQSYVIAILEQYGLYVLNVDSLERSIHVGRHIEYLRCLTTNKILYMYIQPRGEPMIK